MAAPYLFNRWYAVPVNPTALADPGEWVEYEGRAEYFFNDANPVVLRRHPTPLSPGTA